MIIGNERLISDFHKIIKVKYPNLSIEELNLICKSPFLFLKEQMKKISLPIVGFTYFGSFVVYKKRISKAGEIAQQALEQNKITQEKYDKIQMLIQEYGKESNP